MQQTQADPLALVGDEDDSAETKEKLEMVRRLTETEQMENYLSYGKWDLKANDIERLQKDDEMKQRVSINIFSNKITLFIYVVKLQCKTNSSFAFKHSSTSRF